MKIKTRKIARIGAVVAMLVLAIAAFNLPASAQKPAAGPDLTIGKKGEIHFNVPVKAGSVVLEPGMYQVQHAVEGEDHVVTFKEVQMQAGYRHGNTWVSKVVAVGLACKIEPAEKVNNTKVTLRPGAAGTKEIAEVQIAGEAFKHVF